MDYVHGLCREKTLTGVTRNLPVMRRISRSLPCELFGTASQYIHLLFTELVAKINKYNRLMKINVV